MVRILGADAPVVVPGQGLYEVSATALMRLGTRLVRGDCVYKYVKAGGTLDPDFGCWGYNWQCITFAAAPVAKSAGTNVISMTVGASDGPAADGVLAAHYLEGGRVVVFSDTVSTFSMQIVDNTAVASGGGTTVLTLEDDIPVAIATATSYIEAMPSLYVDVRTGNSGGTRPFLGVPLVALSTTYPYGWIQTWGPTWVTPQAALGASASNNVAVFRHDGSVDDCDYSDANNSPKCQHAGRVLTRTAAGAQAAPFLFLEVSP